MMTIRCILLDFGNVVAFFDHRKACQQLAALSSVSTTADDVYDAIFERGLEVDYDTGRISTASFLSVLRTTFHLEATDAEIGRAWSDIFIANDAVVAAIPAMKDRGLRLVLASNTNALHHDWFSREFADTLALLDAQVLSHRVGSRKPERAFFEACLNAAECPASACLYLDDREEFVAAGRHLGLNGLVYTPSLDLLHRDVL
jgi:putative hydrolase of the HAD superfamily